jgi:hypothetical protein
MKIEELREQMEREERFFNEWKDWAIVERRLNAAMARVIERDPCLEDSTGERCIAHRLAVYLEDEFGGCRWIGKFNWQAKGRAQHEAWSASPACQSLAKAKARRTSRRTSLSTSAAVSRNLLAIEVKPQKATYSHGPRKAAQHLTDTHLRYAFAASWSIARVGDFEPIERIEIP